MFIGAWPWWWWYPPPPPYYYYPPAYYPPAYYPPAYVDGGQPSLWYYCAEAKAYYPYVTQCPGGWQQVTPQPPPS